MTAALTRHSCIARADAPHLYVGPGIVHLLSSSVQLPASRSPPRRPRIRRDRISEVARTLRGQTPPPPPCCDEPPFFFFFFFLPIQIASMGLVVKKHRNTEEEERAMEREINETQERALKGRSEVRQDASTEAQRLQALAHAAQARTGDVVVSSSSFRRCGPSAHASSRKASHRHTR